MSPVRWDPDVAYVGCIPPKRITAQPITCNICGERNPLVNVRRWSSFGIWIGETRCCGTTQTIGGASQATEGR